MENPTWKDGFATMTESQAKFAAALRDAGHSWRSVAGHCNTEWQGDWGTNQLAGIDILVQAKKVLSAEYNSIVQMVG